MIHFRDPGSTELSGTRNVLYAGAYSVATVPGVKVVFTLQDGNSGACAAA